MWEPLQRYSALPIDARKLFRRAAILVPAIGASLKIRGYNKTRDWLQKRLDLKAIQYFEEPDIAARLDMTCRMVRAAEHYSLVRVTCLEESLTLWYLLHSQGISSALRIGVRKPAGKFEAHAWVERNGIALNQVDDQHRHYEPFDGDATNTPPEKS